MEMERRDRNKLNRPKTAPKKRAPATVPPGNGLKETPRVTERIRPTVSVEHTPKQEPLIEDGSDVLKGIILAEVLGKPKCRQRR